MPKIDTESRTIIIYRFENCASVLALENLIGIDLGVSLFRLTSSKWRSPFEPHIYYALRENYVLSSVLISPVKVSIVRRNFWLEDFKRI